MWTKPSNLAGTWYAGDAKRLREQVDSLLAAAAMVDVSGPVAALLVPHAAYQYSGRAAASGYALLRNQLVRRVVLLAPSHYAAFRGAVTPPFDAFETPLGQVKIDTAAVREISRLPAVRTDPAPYEQEHSVEIQLPFVQRVAPEATVLPLLIGELRGDDSAVLAGLLAPLLGAGDVLIISSDFTHYGARFGYVPFPPSSRSRVKEELGSLDRGAIALILEGDYSGFREYVAATGATICGRMPVGVLLQLRKGAGGGVLLDYYTSLDVTGDYESSVSYAAIAFPRPLLR